MQQSEKKKSSLSSLPPAVKDISGGILGGIGQCLVGHPFDTIKVRMQTQQQGALALYKGPLDCLKQTIRVEGLGGLYAGVGSPLVGTAALVGVKFFGYGQAKAAAKRYNNVEHFRAQTYAPTSLPTFRFCLSTVLVLLSLILYLGAELTLLQHYLCGSGAGFCAAFVEGPVDFLKSQMQVQIFKTQQIARGGSAALPAVPPSTSVSTSATPSYTLRSRVTPAAPAAAMMHTAAPPSVIVYRNVFHAGSCIVKAHGPLALYQGLQATLLRNLQSNAWFFGFAELTRRSLVKPGQSTSDLPFQYQFLAGGIGGIFFWAFAYPFDVVKSSMQGDNPDKALRRYQNWRHCVSTLWAEGGPKRFWRGFVPCILRSFPANAMAYSGWFFVTQRLLV